ncbi:MAG: hypothetical protein M3O31_13310 [Acidobacteriota bacterium]|nr:hypothetical protein [Acidobacteriota bacterium]
MNDANAHETARQFIGRLLQAVFEAPTGAAGVAALPDIFERDVQLTINGEDFDWRWLEQHVQESHTRLRSVAVEVTHAIREGPILMDRHVVSAIASETGTQWRIEVLAAYELSAENKIRRIHEITRMHAGEYTGW